MNVYNNQKKINQKLELATSKLNPKTDFYTAEETKAFIKSKSVILDIVILGEDTLNQFSELFSLQNLVMAVDLETTGYDHDVDKIVSIGFTVKIRELKSYFIYWHGTDDQLLSELKQLLYNNVCIFHNAKFDLKFLHKLGIDISLIDIRDSMISAYLAYPGRKVNLKHLSAEILEFYYDSFETTLKGRNILDLSVEELAKYNCSDTLATYKLEEHFQLFRGVQDDDIYFLELNVCKILCRMEMTGIRVNSGSLIQLESDYFNSLEQIKKHLESIISFSTDWFIENKEFNINSNKQLKKLLYEKLEIPTKGIKFISTGFSTDEENLQKALLSCTNDDQKLVLNLILEYRKLSKTQTTYVTGILKKVASDNRIRGNFNQCLTVTGRLSSSKPNLQNVPKDSRQAFIPSDGMKLVAIDYSQCEVRILAHFCQDPTLLNAFNEDLDPHLEVAKQLLKKDNITSDERRVCKTINFGIIYGMDATKLAIMTGYSIAEAKEFLLKYWKAFPTVSDWMTKVYIDVVCKGHTTTLLGRKRFFQFYNQTLINSLKQKLNRLDDFEEKKEVLHHYIESFSEYEKRILREAGNAPIQGSNADITKRAMVATEKAILENGFQANLLLQIHDELVWEVSKKQIGDFIEVMQEKMIGVIKLDIPLKTDAHFGNNWKETK